MHRLRLVQPRGQLGGEGFEHRPRGSRFPGGVASFLPAAWGSERMGARVEGVGLLACLLALSVGTNILLWRERAQTPVDPIRDRMRASPVWADLVASRRPLTIVLGDLFMFTQVDCGTGRTLTVRDELQTEQILNNDIIYIGPLTGLGPLFGYYESRSRYRFNPADSTLTDIEAHRAFSPQGALSAERLDAGPLQVVWTVTSSEGLGRLESKLRTVAGALPDSFEALLSVAGFRQTDLSADVVAVSPLAAGLSSGRPARTP